MNGERYGYGTFDWKDGVFYKGHWVKNKASGEGKLTISKNEFY